jgi:hypothetical protein
MGVESEDHLSIMNLDFGMMVRCLGERGYLVHPRDAVGKTLAVESALDGPFMELPLGDSQKSMLDFGDREWAHWPNSNSFLGRSETPKFVLTIRGIALHLKTR